MLETLVESQKCENDRSSGMLSKVNPQSAMHIIIIIIISQNYIILFFTYVYISYFPFVLSFWSDWICSVISYPCLAYMSRNSIMNINTQAHTRICIICLWIFYIVCISAGLRLVDESWTEGMTGSPAYSLEDLGMLPNLPHFNLTLLCVYNLTWNFHHCTSCSFRMIYIIMSI